MRDFALIQASPGRVIVGWGPFTCASARLPGRTAFYLPDFFLDEPHPWLHPDHCEEMSTADFARVLGTGASRARIEWEPLWAREYHALFGRAQRALRDGLFQKIVPVIFEQGTLRGEPRELARYLATRIPNWPAVLRAYGWVRGERGLWGATPEVLFESDGDAYHTMAVAGTRPLALQQELLHDPKEISEHDIVARDIARRLAPFGPVTMGPRELQQLPRLAHLKTPISFRPYERGASLFMDMVARLHPTAALGVWPRNGAGSRWLREADTVTGGAGGIGARRGAYGAPFGFEEPSGRALCVVAIRNAAWRGRNVRVGSGSGVLLESSFEKEWRELRNKRAQVKSLLGLE